MRIEQEIERYRFMWEGRKYRRASPGMRHVLDLIHYSAREKGDTLIDLGCGMGHTGKFLSKYFNVFLFDLIPEAVEVEGLPFIQGNVWDLSALPQFDWIFSSDLLEHIPPERVDATLDGMARITKKGGMLAVCHLESWSTDFQIEGEPYPLHLTVQPRQWWQEKIESRWQLNQFQTNWKETTFIVGGPCLEN